MPPCPRRSSSHACSCQKPVRVLAPVGLALQSDAPGMLSRLAGTFPESPHHPGVFIADGAGFADRVRRVLEGASPLERASVRAAALGPDGAFDPWAAAPAWEVLDRLDSPWLPELLNGKHFRCHFQPIVHAGTFETHGFEALLRASPPFDARGVGEIIAAAKAHHALLKLDQIARQSAIRQGYPQLHPGEQLFINFFPMTIYDPAVCLRTTFAAAREIGADLSRLVFEVVESEAFPEISHLRSILDAYREAGARVALDDLGSGYTAMNFIDELEPDYVKIDKSIVERASETGEEKLLRGLVDHTREKGIAVIAEGIESPRDLALVRRAGVDLVQGWLIAKPSERMRRVSAPPEARAA